MRFKKCQKNAKVFGSPCSSSVYHLVVLDEDTNDDIASLPVNTAVVQTRIRMKDMRMMISLRDVYEGMRM